MSDFHENQVAECPCHGDGPQDHLCCGVIAAELLRLRSLTDQQRLDSARDAQACLDAANVLKQVADELDTAKELAADAIADREVFRASLAKALEQRDHWQEQARLAERARATAEQEARQTMRHAAFWDRKRVAMAEALSRLLAAVDADDIGPGPIEDARRVLETGP